MSTDEPQPQPQQYPSHPYALSYPPAPAPRPRGRRALVGVGAAAVAAAMLVAGVEIGHATQTTSGTGSVASSSNGWSDLPGQNANETQSSGGAATASQQAGIVTVVSRLTYENAEAAGTGIVLTSNGEILTNNHVIDGATSVRVTVVATGKTYRATVVGTDPTDDVAVLQLRNASGLTTAHVGGASDVNDVSVGDTVTGVGNAGGTGTLTAASGSVTALDQAITASDENGSNAERLTGLIETDANIVSGDSGGPLYDADGTIIGIDTAGSSTNGVQTAYQSTTESYAIPITTALTIADQIESGLETSTVHIGLPAFLGVGVADTNARGAGISAVLPGGAAADAGITAGSMITAIDGKSVTSAASLQQRLASYQPGDTATIRWTDASGRAHKATITFATGPAD